MPVLSKSRHELFSQAVANGRSLDDAYSDAGFVRNRGNASKLMRNTAIQSRVDELLQERAKGTLQKTISEVHYTREVLLAELEEARKMAIKRISHRPRYQQRSERRVFSASSSTGARW